MSKGKKRGRNYDPTKNWPTKGKRPKSSAQERLEYCREQWEADPHIPINGRNGMNQRLMEVFGITARSEQLMAVRSEVLSRKKAARTFNPVLSVDQADALKKAPPRHDVTEPPQLTLIDEKEEDMNNRRNSYPVVPAPGCGRSIDDAQIRYDWARSYLQRYPKAGNREIIDKVRAEFGVGIGGSALGTIRRELGVGQVRRRRNERRRPSPPAPKTKPHTVARISEAPAVTTTVQSSASPEEVIRAAIGMLVDDVPGLRKLTLEIVDGKPVVAYDIAVQSVESGKVEL